MFLIHLHLIRYYCLDHNLKPSIKYVLKQNIMKITMENMFKNVDKDLRVLKERQMEYNTMMIDKLNRKMIF